MFTYIWKGNLFTHQKKNSVVLFTAQFFSKFSTFPSWLLNGPPTSDVFIN